MKCRIPGYMAFCFSTSNSRQHIFNHVWVLTYLREQYKVYLFDRILLCCKEINPNKPKNKMLGTNKPLVDKKGKLKLQLKGRIFMQNVTDVVTVKRAGNETLNGSVDGMPC